MYCIRCGVELADSEQRCPLCQTLVFHPELTRPEGEKQYPPNLYPAPQERPFGHLLIVTMAFLLAGMITALCNIQISGRITWSGYVIGGLLLGYVMIVLPFWFKNPNPVIFVPCNFVAIALLLLYVNCVTNGNWFLSFAFPVTGTAGLIVTAVVALTRYIHRGRLYIYGGAAILSGGLMLLIEMMLNITLGRKIIFLWSPYPFIALTLLGITLLIIAIFRPLRDSLRKRTFL